MTDSEDTQFHINEQEEWKFIPGFEGVYSVSNMGRIRRDKQSQGARAGLIMRLRMNPSGYLIVLLRDNGYNIQRIIPDLVAGLFLGPRPFNHRIIYLNGDPRDCRASNLAYQLVEENASLDGEEWRMIPDYEGLYSVSSLGRIRSETGGNFFVAGHVKKLIESDNGYLRIYLSKNGTKRPFTVHSLVALAFIGPREKGLQVNHINGNKFDNRPSNLEYVTCLENHRHASRTGLKPFGDRNGTHTKPETVRRGEASPSSKLVEANVIDIRRRLALGEHRKSIAADYNVTPQLIRNIGRRDIWKHVP